MRSHSCTIWLLSACRQWCHGYATALSSWIRNVNGTRQMHAGQLLGQDGDPHAGGYQADLGDGFG